MRVRKPFTFRRRKYTEGDTVDVPDQVTADRWAAAGYVHPEAEPLTTRDIPPQPKAAPPPPPPPADDPVDDPVDDQADDEPEIEIDPKPKSRRSKKK